MHLYIMYSNNGEGLAISPTPVCVWIPAATALLRTVCIRLSQSVTDHPNYILTKPISFVPDHELLQPF